MADPVYDDKNRRWDIFRLVAPWFGRTVTSRFLQNTSEYIPGVERIHHLIRGSYKPAWTDFPLAIQITHSGQYEDKISYAKDGMWRVYYSPEAGPLDDWQNASLFKLIQYGEPVIVTNRISDKTDHRGARHHIMGLGLFQSFDENLHSFLVQGAGFDMLQQVIGSTINDELLDTALRLEALEAWVPFIEEGKSIYKLSAEKRDNAFRGVILDNYCNTCAVTGQRFHFGDNIEAEAAHIISKYKRGTDDPRNGIALSRSVHWAFDKGIFTISDQYEIVIHPRSCEANYQQFSLMNLDRKRLTLPEDDYYFPHPEALKWHRDNKFGEFLIS